MRGTVLYGPRDVGLEDHEDPRIENRCAFSKADGSGAHDRHEPA